MPRHLLIVWKVKNCSMLLETEVRCGTGLASSFMTTSAQYDLDTRKWTILLLYLSLSCFTDDFSQEWQQVGRSTNGELTVQLWKGGRR